MKKLLLVSLLAAAQSFAAIQYAGGTNVNAQCTATAGTKQELSDCIEDNLNTAGWTTISGHHTSTVLLESIATPTAALQMRLQLTQGTNCVILKGRNVGNTKAASTGQFLLPAAAKVFRVIANKYQYFIATDGATLARSWAAGGTPYVPSFAGITEGIWTAGNATSDTDTNTGTSFKFSLTLNGCGGSSQANYWATINGTQLEFQSNTNAGYSGVPQFLLPQTATNAQTNFQPYRWFDTSSFISEPLLALSVTGANGGEPFVIGSLWDGAIITASIASETSLTFDSHNWLAHTNSNTGTPGSCAKGTLVLVVP